MIAMIRGFAKDLRYAGRSLRRQPVFALTAVLTLALGIGATALVFSLIDGVLLRPLPFPEPDRLVQVWERNPSGDERNVVSPPNLVDWRERTTAFQGLAARVNQPITLAHEDGPREIRADFVSPEYFNVLGVPPLLGATFPPETGADEPVEHLVLSHALWLTEFGADPDIVGQSVPIGGADGLVVLGVMPRGFGMPGVEADVWLPFVATSDRPAGRFLHVVGRLAPGATLEQARAQLSAAAANIAAEHPQFNEGWGATVVPLQEQVVGDVRPSLLLLFASVGLLLLLACANIANLLLGRSATRTREFAVRLSLGATRRRLTGQLLTESLLLGTVGGLVALILVALGHTLLLPQLAGALEMPRLAEVAIDGRLLAVTAAITLGATVLFGLAPALTAAESGPALVLREAGAGSMGKRRARLRGALIVGQVGLATMLLIGAGLLGRSLWELQRADLGIQPEQVVTMRFSLVGPSFQTPEQRNQAMDQIFERVRALPGVAAVGSVNWLPLAGQHSRTIMQLEGQPPPVGGEGPGSDIAFVDGDYFAAMGIPLLGGRTFGPEDHADAGWVFVVDQTLARRHFGPGEVLGSRVNYWWGPDSQWGPIVGVVGSIRHHGYGEEAYPTTYFNARQVPSSTYTLVTRAANGPPNLAELIRREVQAVAPTRPVADIRTMEEVVATSIAGPRATAMLIGTLALLALVLAAVGLYGVVSYAAAQRTRELGIRIALGASQQRVLGLVLRQGILLTAVGLGLGLMGAVAVRRLLAGMLYGVGPLDPLTLMTVCSFLFGISVLASWLPGRRAARVDPLIAMRSE
jgi:putative ABC transport system permease protein